MARTVASRNNACPLNPEYFCMATRLIPRRLRAAPLGGNRYTEQPFFHRSPDLPPEPLHSEHSSRSCLADQSRICPRPRLQNWSDLACSENTETAIRVLLRGNALCLSKGRTIREWSDSDQPQCHELRVQPGR